MFICRKVSIFAASISLLSIFLFLSFSKILPAQEYAPIETASIPKGLYDLETAEFLYLTRDYPDAFISSKEILRQNRNTAEVERALLLKGLSALYLQYHDNAPHGLVSEVSAPGIFLLFDTLYRQGDYNAMLSLSNGAADAVSLYFRGLAFYMLDRFDETIGPLGKIPEKETIFPNAMMLLSQTMAAKGDFRAAERYLNEAVNTAKGEMLNKAHLLMGYLYFEKGEFLNARESFLKVDAKSGFYRYARLGAAWSDIRMGLYDRALSLTENTGEHVRGYDTKELEMKLALAYSQYRLGRLKDAKEGFLGALKDLKTAEEKFGLLAEGNSLRNKYSMLLTGMERGNIPADDAAYIGFFKDAPDIALAAAHYNGFIVIKSSYEKRDADIDSLIISLKQSIKAKEEVMADAAGRIGKIKKLLAGLAKKIEGAASKESSKGDNLSSSEHIIVQRWEKLLNRSLTEPEKYIVHLIAMSGEEGLWCLNNTTYCPILYMMTIDPSKNRAESPEEGILERIVKDTEGLTKGGQILHEKEMGSIKGAVSNRMGAQRSLIQRLEALRAAVAKDKKNAEQGAGKSLKLLEENIGRRAAIMRYEIRTLEQKAAAGLEDADRAMEALKK